MNSTTESPPKDDAKLIHSMSTALENCFKRREQIEHAARHVFLVSRSKPVDPELNRALVQMATTLNKFGTKGELKL